MDQQQPVQGQVQIKATKGTSGEIQQSRDDSHNLEELR